MKVLVTGSAGHLGEALMRTLRAVGHAVVGMDIVSSSFTDVVGSITDRAFVKQHMRGVAAVLHTATLHKPHMVTHARRQFIDTNIAGTLNLLEEAAAAGVGAFVFTSSTSAFGRALVPAAGGPAVWVTEDLAPLPRNIYGVSKIAAENICELVHRDTGLPCIVLRTARFFPEEDDAADVRKAYQDANIKANEFLHRRVDIEDVVSAHLLAMQKALALKFDRFIISATTPFKPEDAQALRDDAPAVVRRRLPGHEAEYARRGWCMFASLDRVYVNGRARRVLGWQPRHDFASIIERLRDAQDIRSPLAQLVGAKGYHDQTFDDGPYPVA